jgi:hypothetical protein
LPSSDSISIAGAKVCNYTATRASAVAVRAGKPALPVPICRIRVRHPAGREKRAVSLDIPTFFRSAAGVVAGVMSIWYKSVFLSNERLRALVFQGFWASKKSNSYSLPGMGFGCNWVWLEIQKRI